VVEAARLADHGETFVLDMGEPVRIVDVVQSFARLMNREVEIRFTGMRPGEKLNETLFSENENPTLTEHPRIYRTDASHPAPGFYHLLRTLYHAAEANDRVTVLRTLHSLLPEYRPETPSIPAQPALYPDDF
jgi:FlaA1/EpsC-like NDP-sugar epimerase